MVTPRIPRMCARTLTHRIIKSREKKSRLTEIEPRDRLLKFARARIDRTNRGVLLLPSGCVMGRKKEGRGRQDVGRGGQDVWEAAPGEETRGRRMAKD